MARQTPVNSRAVAITFGILGVLFFSTKAVFVKLAYAHDIDPVSLLLLRMAFALPFYLAMVVSHRKGSALASREYLYIFLAGFFGYYLASYLDFLGLKYVKASVERLILFTYPTLVVLLSFLFLKKKISRGQGLALLLSYTGILLVFMPELVRHQNENVTLGAILIFLSSLSYASYIVGSGWIIPKVGATRFTSYCMTVSCSLVIIHYTVQVNDFSTLLMLPGPVYGYGLLMAIVSTIIPSYLVSLAIKNIGANQFAIFGTLGPISTIVLSYIFLSERLAPLQLIGGAVVIFGVLLAEIKKSRS